MSFHSWARKWSIPAAAIADWEKQVGLSHLPTSSHAKTSEQAVQNQIRLEASRKACRLWRNNIGAVYTQDGSFLRYGLANDSAQMNREIKSADLIGIRIVEITPGMVGTKIGQFVSREVKPPHWKFKNTDREKAQLRWIELINMFGGDAAFATSEGTL
jgi:hypothetical protein